MRLKGRFRVFYIQASIMKNLLLIITIVCSFNLTAFASNIEVNIEKESKDFILSSSIDANKATVNFVFESKVSIIQVFNNAGEIEMVLPINSEIVDLGLSLFPAGTYKLGFVVEGFEEMQFSHIIIE